MGAARWHSGDVPSPDVPVPAATAPRETRQRRALLEALDDSPEFRSAQAIHAALREAGVQVGLATVYRSLKQLADGHEVDVVRDAAGEQLFRRCAAVRHHHHLVCRVCGTAVEVESAPVEDWAAAVGREHGFSDVGHSLEVFGVCSECHAAAPAAG